MKSGNSKSVQKLIRLGICQSSDIKQAQMEANRFSSAEYAKKIRKAERYSGTIGDSNRIKILLLLSKHEMCVCELESALGLPQPTVSHHLGILEQSGLLERSKKARFVFYRTRQSPALEFFKCLMQLVAGRE